MDHLNHILTQEGILASFSVSRKLTETEVKKMMDTLEKEHGREKAAEVLKEKIVGEMKEAMVKNKIPGLIIPKGEDEEAEEQIRKNLPPGMYEKLVLLNKMVMVVAVKMMEKKLDKFSMCYFINTLVNALSLSEKDFDAFHSQFSQYRNPDGEDDDDEEDDEE